MIEDSSRRIGWGVLSTGHIASVFASDLALLPEEARLVAVGSRSLDKAEAVIDGADLVIAGTRVLPSQLRTAVIHRIELPQGRFERRVRLPAGRYRDVRRSAADGCLVITLQKAEAGHG